MENNNYKNSQGRRPSYNDRFKNHSNATYPQKPHTYEKVKEETVEDILLDIERIIKEINIEIDYIKRLRL